ncbi:Uncharacterised protein [Shigella sonnei]|nr:Uncharacterised protein [Shigella sonnei]
MATLTKKERAWLNELQEKSPGFCGLQLAC